MEPNCDLSRNDHVGSSLPLLLSFSLTLSITLFWSFIKQLSTHLFIHIHIYILSPVVFNLFIDLYYIYRTLLGKCGTDIFIIGFLKTADYTGKLYDAFTEIIPLNTVEGQQLLTGVNESVAHLEVLGCLVLNLHFSSIL